MPACTECRKRKLGCSKEKPTCKECRRLGAECIYEAKEKPGLKPGAVENLNRRVDKIELLLTRLQNQSQSQSDTNSVFQEEPKTAASLLRSFERELKKFNNTVSHGGVFPTSQAGSPAIFSSSYGSFMPSFNSRKRKHCHTARNTFSWEAEIFTLVSEDGVNISPPVGVLDAVLDCYFSQVHPWIPMIYEKSLREQLSQQTYEPHLEVVLHAICVAALRFAKISIDSESRLHYTNASRERVVLTGMNSLALENLQALVIIAFDDIGHGDATRAWSIVGSLTRTVEYLQLTVESDDTAEQHLLKPCTSLPPAENWTDMETRRRVFWTIFSLDRLCSVMTGWNTSLTSDDVYRRLPVDGALWRKQEPVTTPLFGIWDKSAGKIGKSIACLPSHYDSPQRVDEEQPSPPGVADFEKSVIGAFAYCIEATESMSRVTTYFLQQKINLNDHKRIGSWLTRFKELDLRLVNWKIFLPQKWKDTNISHRSAEAAIVRMDPNLTLAHITHNTSMILLHQLIAYPPSEWKWASRLPSRWSAETCQAAAIETSSITENYLSSPTTSKIVSSQFVFCVFLTARVLLVHWRYYSDDNPLSEFAKLLNCLETMADRWEGNFILGYRDQHNLAAKYANLLKEMHRRCASDLGFRIDVLGYAKDLGTYPLDKPPAEFEWGWCSPGRPDVSQKKQSISQARKGISQTSPRPQQISGRTHRPPTQTAGLIDGINNENHNQSQNHSSISHEIPQFSSPYHEARRHLESVESQARPIGLTNNLTPANPVNYGNIPGRDNDDPISRMFLDQQFLDMDRVISYDEGLFTSNMQWWGQDS